MEETTLTEFHCQRPCGKLLCKYEDTDNPYAFEIKCNNQRCHRVSYHGNCIATNMVEVRCQNIDPKKSAKAGEPVKCNKLLAKVLPGTVLQVKCKRCGSIVDIPIKEDNTDAKTTD